MMNANTPWHAGEPAPQPCCAGPLECAKRGLPTVAAFLIALASSVVMTFAG